jgi:hypothetical protein
MIDPPFRSPRDRVGGLCYLGRMLDKIRCHLRGELPEEYRPHFGLNSGLDGMLCAMLGVTHADLIERMRDGGNDEELLEWCYAHGIRAADSGTRIGSLSPDKRMARSQT